MPVPLPYVFTTIAGQRLALAPGPDLAGAFAAWSDDEAAPASRTVIVAPGSLSLTIELQTASAVASPSASSSSAPAASDSETSQFAGRASSGASAAQQAGPWELLARLALAVFAAEVIEQQRGIFDGLRDGADLVERGGEGH
jgi:hypothetical protein